MNKKEIIDNEYEYLIKNLEEQFMKHARKLDKKEK